MKRKNKIKTQSLFSWRDFLLFFAINAFVLTCCTLMLLSDINPVHVNASKNAVKTFFNVIGLSVLFFCCMAFIKNLHLNGQFKKY